MGPILVAYSSWAGATHEIADGIAKVFKEKDIVVEVLPSKEIKSISEYQAVILGTSIHAGQTVNTFNKFLKEYHDELIQKSVAVFVVCANMMEDELKNRKETTEWLHKTMEKYPDVKPVSTGLFAGALITEGEDFNKLNFLFRKLIESMRDNLLKEYGKTDFRDWEKIRVWAEDTYNLIKQAN